MVMFPFVLNVFSLLLVIAIVIVAMFGSGRTRIAALAGGVFWVAGFAVTFVAARGSDSTTTLFFLSVSGILHIVATACLALAGLLPSPAPDAYPRTNPTYTPNPPSYGTGQPGGYEHLPRAGEAPPRNFPNP